VKSNRTRKYAVPAGSIRFGRHPALAVVLAACLACGPSSETRLEEARQLQGRGRFAESLEPLRELLEAHPSDPEANQLYGLALVRTGRSSVAVWPLRQAAEDPERAVEAGYLLAGALAQSLDFEEAIAALDRVLELEPEHVGALSLRATAHLRTHRDEEALLDVERAIQLDPDDAGLLVTRAGVLIQLERLDEAEAALEAAAARLADARDAAPEPRAGLCVAQATFVREREDPERAEELFEACLEEFPATQLVVAQAVEFFDAAGRFERSSEILRRALEEAPEQMAFRIALAARLRALRRAEEAEALLLDATETWPSLSSWTALGDHHVALEDYAAARAAFGQAMALQPNPNPILVFGYADMLIHEGKLAEARGVAETLDRPYSDLLRGRILLVERDARAALEALEAGIALWPQNPTARALAGEAAEHIGDFDRAISEYRDSIRADASYTSAALRLARLHAGEGRYELALSALAHYTLTHHSDSEGFVLAARLAAAAGHRNLANQALAKLGQLPGQLGHAVAERAAFLRTTAGNAAAAQSIESAELDLTDPANAEALRALVETLAAAGEPDAAITRADAALAAHRDEADFQEIHALALRGADRPRGDVRAAYERALELEPDHVRSLMGLARLSAEDGAPETAVALYDRAAAADPEDPVPAWSAIELLADPGTEALEPRLEDLLWRHPRHAQAADRLARLLLARGGEADRALELALRAVRFRGGAAALDTLGWVRMAHGALDEAIRALERSLELRPDAPSTRYRLGRARAAKGDLEGARAAYQQAIEGGAFPEREAALADLARLAPAAGGTQ
jgi:tetratricopeptide (TPR) repeat protein